MTHPESVSTKHRTVSECERGLTLPFFNASIPAKWKVAPLKHVASINTDVLPEATAKDWELDYVDIGNVDALGRIVGSTAYTFGDAPSRARRLVHDGDTVVSTVRTYLKAIAFVHDPAPNLVVSTGFAALTPRTGLAPRFLWRMVQSEPLVSAIVACSEGVGYPAITPTRLGDLKVWLPPPDEQERICGFLDSRCSKIDEIIAKKQRLIDLLAEQKSALITRAVTRGLDPSVPMKDSGVAWIGCVPANWTVAPLGFRYSVQLGKMLDAARISGSHLAPYLRNVDVQWDRINVEDLPQMDFPPGERSYFRLRRGDLLVCEGGEVGRAAIWDGQLEECYYQKALHRLRTLSTRDFPRFLYYALYAAAQMQVFVAGSNQNTIDHLTGEKLKKHKFAFPPADEQLSIARTLDEQCQRIERIIKACKSQLTALSEYRSALITAAVTGQIDVNTAA